jgi:hypothetical protein
MEKIDTKAAGEINAATLEALRPVAERFGLTVETTGGSYDPVAGWYKPKIVFATSGSEEAAFARDCGYVGAFDGMPGLAAADYGATFGYHGKTFRLVGVNLRARRFPLVAVDEADGRRYKLPESAIAAVVAARAEG